ncbi:uncharacterized protein LOC102721167 [Oryza brachyantha]|uniref:Uncharacterized protein n=1 Tax=Oryza brachyantha TaxID=4533 RepID=J3M7A6_ORYBR|nr:uncharacterized protein LOC102721167 [Oryza brachyantha]
MLPLLLLLLLLLFACAAVPVSTARDAPPGETAPETPLFGGGGGDEKPSAYEMLERFGFPRGILPEGVTGYTLRPSSGEFEVYLGGTEDIPCEFEVDGGYRLTYQRRIYGRVSGGSISDLHGVTVRVFFMNWGIDRVVMADAAHLMFYVGPLSQSFSADSFDESPRCRYRHSGGAIAVAVM